MSVTVVVEKDNGPRCPSCGRLVPSPIGPVPWHLPPSGARRACEGVGYGAAWGTVSR